jgi:hypothetical protein
VSGGRDPKEAITMGCKPHFAIFVEPDGPFDRAFREICRRSPGIASRLRTAIYNLSLKESIEDTLVRANGWIEIHAYPPLQDSIEGGIFRVLMQVDRDLRIITPIILRNGIAIETDSEITEIITLSEKLLGI